MEEDGWVVGKRGSGKWVGMGMVGRVGFGVSQSLPLVVPPGARGEG